MGEEEGKEDKGRWKLGRGRRKRKKKRGVCKVETRNRMKRRGKKNNEDRKNGGRGRE